MKSFNSSGNFRPFQNLKALLEEKDFQLKPAEAPVPEEPNDRVVDNRPDRTIFEEAMAGVQRITWSNGMVTSPVTIKPPSSDKKTESESLARLKELVEYGAGFVVCLTPEYIEGRTQRVSPEVTRRLHQGNFSIQAHIDLHGYGVVDARQVFNEFLNESITAGKRAVLVIHGRGLSSPQYPVLKTKVYQWLTTAPWHKWVIAFTSARLCDGGAGATYVLLRRQPLTKRFRKRKKKPQITSERLPPTEPAL